METHQIHHSDIYCAILIHIIRAHGNTPSCILGIAFEPASALTVAIVA